MTTDDSATPPTTPPSGPPPDEPGTPAPAPRETPPEQPKRRRRHRVLTALARTLVFVVFLVVLAGGLLYGAITTERGTRLAWQTAVSVLGGRLAGTVEGGSLATGVRLKDVAWRSSLDSKGADKGDEIKIDRISGRWGLTRSPWRFTVDYLHLGTIDARIVPSPPSTEPTVLPQDLQLPMQLDVRDLRVEKLVLHEGTSTSEYSRLIFRGRSDGRHHEASVERLDTPFGALTAEARLDGVRPFALTGNAGYSGKVNEEPVQVRARVSGTLEALVADLDATGMKLAGQARVEAAPFSDVPLTRATLAFDHVNPQAFSPGAPFADLAVRANLAPVTGPGAEKALASGTSGASPASGAVAAGKAPASSSDFVVAGQVSIVNAKPGQIGEQLLPLIDAHADVRLDAHEQRISNLNVRLVKSATLTGGGALAGGKGKFDLRVAGLDLNTFEASVRQTALAGPIGITLDGAKQAITFDLADPKAALRAQAQVTQDSAQIAFNNVRVSSGKGRIDLSGALKHDAHSSYDVKATLTDFDPLSLMAPGKVSAGKAAAGKAGKQAGKRALGRSGTSGAAASKPGSRETGKPATAAEPATQAAAPAERVAKGPIEARVNGTLTATGVLGPTLTTKAQFKLGESVYDGMPLTGAGTVQLAGSRILPSSVNLSIAGNQVDLNGSFGTPRDRLKFHVDAPQLDRLGFGLAGFVQADGDITGSFAHPNVELAYQADNVAFGDNRLGHAEGRAELRDGAHGAMMFTTDARDLSSNGVELKTLTAQLTGTRAKHTLQAAAAGSVHGRPVDLTLAADGSLTDSREGTRWDGTVTRLANKGMPALNLESALTVSAGPQRVVLGATRLALEGATLDLKSFALDHGNIRTAGSLSNVSVARLLEIQQELTGQRPPVKTDLVFDSDWDLNVGQTASGYWQLKRRVGDVTLDTGRGVASLGITDIAARAEFGDGRRLSAKVHAQASRIGTVDANVAVPLAVRDGVLAISEDAPLSGAVNADVPSLTTTGGLFGPSYLLDGHLALKLTIAGTAAKPNLSGSLTGDNLSATLVDQGVQLKNGVIRIALSENLVEFQNVEFHGGDGTLRATGRVRLDSAEPDLTASIVADKLELFASPDRQLSLSGSATVANGGTAGIDINGKFRVNKALFDMPEQAAPHLGDDVVIVRSDGTVRGQAQEIDPTNKPVGRFAPRADVDLNLGDNFRFRGQGADLGLRGTITALSAPNLPLRAIGNVRVTEGSTYTAFGRKLAIENGFFTFNGPVANPGINILAMRRNQEVEAGVQVTGTIQSPVAKLVSEPNVPDNEKLSWLLFGHGTDQGNNLGQQSTMTTALALLGSATGKRVAQTIGLDEFTVGRSEVGLTDPQVVMVSKAINEWLVLGYEQGLQAADNAVKATLNLTRFWSVSLYGGTFQGMDLNFTRRFDSLFGGR
ncbi:translocation and assembly module protein TamB [Trinickia violacea]|uniref:Translocation and assembly module protein TamB n=1 Tax=Trinickia violacea TaxID=2571746 RepID=A0A4P8IIM4_9BURK|nr:translocation/assembly module TamB domain-containing protein [Trinickia violacea]QCP48592.1 translocation and assembly module protein TamB [Trinickia violacea]